MKYDRNKYRDPAIVKAEKKLEEDEQRRKEWSDEDRRNSPG